MGYAKKWFRAIGQSRMSRNLWLGPIQNSALPQFAIDAARQGWLDQTMGADKNTAKYMSKAEERRFRFNRNSEYAGTITGRLK